MWGERLKDERGTFEPKNCPLPTGKIRGQKQKIQIP
jgi:hypothetical protein